MPTIISWWRESADRVSSRKQVRVDKKVLSQEISRDSGISTRRLPVSLFGGNGAKKDIVRNLYGGVDRATGDRMSVGLIAEHFLNIENFRYTGIDIDGKAIDVARTICRQKTILVFFCVSISSFKNNSDRLFDVVMIFGMLHHVEEQRGAGVVAGCRVTAER